MVRNTPTVMGDSSRHNPLRALLATGLAAVLVGVPAAAFASQRTDFVAVAGRAAQPGQAEFGVPASVTVAQAILESGWGNSDLATDHHNYFGMKCHDRDPGPIAAGCVEVPTKECDAQRCWHTTAYFRQYRSMADSYRDHGAFLRDGPRYAKAFDHTDDADRFIAEVHRAGYATDPKYTDKIIGLMKQYDLYRFNHPGGADSGGRFGPAHPTEPVGAPSNVTDRFG